MKLLKIILVFFIIYFVRRAFQFYRAVKRIQQENLQRQNEFQQTAAQPKADGEVVNAEFKVLD